MTKQLSIVGGGSSINLLLHIWSSAADFCVIILVLSDCIFLHRKKMAWVYADLKPDSMFLRPDQSQNKTKDGYLPLNHLLLWLQQPGLFSWGGMLGAIYNFRHFSHSFDHNDRKLVGLFRAWPSWVSLSEISFAVIIDILSIQW